MLPPVKGSSTSPLFELLLCCSRTAIDLDTESRIKQLCHESIDWDLLQAIAHEHHLLPLLHWTLNRIAYGEVPDDVLYDLSCRFIDHCRSASSLDEELCRLCAIFDRAGVLCVPFKGAVLADRYYGDLALRSFVDIDFWVNVKDIQNATQILRANGFEPCPWRQRQFTDDFFQSQFYPKFCYEYTFLNSSTGIFVDLHWQIAPSELWRISAEELSESVEPYVLEGSQVNIFNDKVTLALLCVHASKHGWAKLNWMVDVAEVLCRFKETSWDDYLLWCRRGGIDGMVLLGVHLASQLPAVKVSESLSQHIRSRPEISKIASTIMDFIQREPFYSEMSESAKWLMHLKLKSTWRERYKLLVQNATKPTLDEYAAAPQFANFLPVYSTMRLGRVLFETVRVALDRTAVRVLRLPDRNAANKS